MICYFDVGLLYSYSVVCRGGETKSWVALYYLEISHVLCVSDKIFHDAEIAENNRPQKSL